MPPGQLLDRKPLENTAATAETTAAAETAESTGPARAAKSAGATAKSTATLVGRTKVLRVAAGDVEGRDLANLREERREAKEIVLAPNLERMEMALGALQPHAEEQLADRSADLYGLRPIAASCGTSSGADA